jgi:hypothetical protein
MSMNNIEDFREAIIADTINKIQSMSKEELVRELINFKACAIEKMTCSQLIDFRKSQVKELAHQYGIQE